MINESSGDVFIETYFRQIGELIEACAIVQSSNIACGKHVRHTGAAGPWWWCTLLILVRSSMSSYLKPPALPVWPLQ